MHVACEETEMEGNKPQKHPRRHFADEFKAGAVYQVHGEVRGSADVARSLDVTPSALDRGVKWTSVDPGNRAPRPRTSLERGEVAQPQPANRRPATVQVGSRMMPYPRTLEWYLHIVWNLSTPFW
jgi:transposase-like protein